MEAPTISGLLRTLLARRGIESQAAIDAFLYPDYAAHTHSPFLLNGMQKAVDRVLRSIVDNKHIAVYADFDCDGIPGASILSDFFRKIGYENFEVYLPHRDREGYGFHKEAINTLASRGVSLIITVDVGTVAHEGIAHANEKEIDVIVTDHHEIMGKLPDAYAILNPKIPEYPFPDLCGAAVAFKLVQALLQEGRQREIPAFSAIPDGWEKWLLDLVAIATVADMVPLLGENRALAFWGLQVLRKSPRPGISALCARLRLKKSELSEDDIGFSIAPRINAASRMDEPDLAFRLLTTRDHQEADHLTAQLESLNASRKGIVAGIVKSARKSVRERFAASEKVVVLGNPEWKPALLGLAANSIMEERGGVVCLWGRDGNGTLKGSCRSDGTIPLPDLFSKARESFVECGGHNASGGFTVTHEQVHTLPEVLRAIAEALPETLRESTDNEEELRVTLREISLPLYSELSHLAPFGIGNKKPVLRISRVAVVTVRQFGKENNHIELMLRDGNNTTVRGFDFFRSRDDFSFVPHENEIVDVLATLERDTFRSPERFALRLIDILSA
ncbi:MAG TPA: single-stranded-DNA-specific exonuclease RecJ [Candidatus Paceibacterota bacterium]|nr:single-stranded-DNA-specific exonuclease RecJ [Candidatus Paceibacterota bacterium]